MSCYPPEYTKGTRKKIQAEAESMGVIFKKLPPNTSCGNSQYGICIYRNVSVGTKDVCPSMNSLVFSHEVTCKMLYGNNIVVSCPEDVDATVFVERIRPHIDILLMANKIARIHQ